MFLTNHSSAFLLHDICVVKNVACLSSLLIHKDIKSIQHIDDYQSSFDLNSLERFGVIFNGEDLQKVNN